MGTEKAKEMNTRSSVFTWLQKTGRDGADMSSGIGKLEGVPRQQPHRRSGLATLPSVGAVP